MQVRSYDRESHEQAVIDLAYYEMLSTDDANVLPVLVSAGPIDQLKKAYPNFFLDINDFEQRVRSIIRVQKRKANSR